MNNKFENTIISSDSSLIMCYTLLCNTAVRDWTFKNYPRRMELMNIWEGGIRGEVATDAVRDADSAIFIKAMQNVELIPTQLLKMRTFTD